MCMKFLRNCNLKYSFQKMYKKLVDRLNDQCEKAVLGERKVLTA